MGFMQGISNVAWALASVGHLDIDFLDRVVAQCGSQLTSFDVQALANLVSVFLVDKYLSTQRDTDLQLVVKPSLFFCFDAPCLLMINAQSFGVGCVCVLVSVTLTFLA